jgi:hypothetical protein
MAASCMWRSCRSVDSCKGEIDIVVGCDDIDGGGTTYSNRKAFRAPPTSAYCSCIASPGASKKANNQSDDAVSVMLAIAPSCYSPKTFDARVYDQSSPWAVLGNGSSKLSAGENTRSADAGTRIATRPLAEVAARPSRPRITRTASPSTKLVGESLRCYGISTGSGYVGDRLSDSMNSL